MAVKATVMEEEQATVVNKPLVQEVMQEQVTAEPMDNSPLTVAATKRLPLVLMEAQAMDNSPEWILIR